MSNAMVHHWREKDREKFSREAEKSAESLKETAERADRNRTEQRLTSNGDLQDTVTEVQPPVLP